MTLEELAKQYSIPVLPHATPEKVMEAVQTSDYNNLYIYRYVHIDNLQLFVKDNNRIRPSSHTLEGYVHIGADKHTAYYQNSRDSKTVTINNIQYKFKDSVPFFLSPHPPMLNNILKGERGAKQRPMSEIVCIVIKLQTIMDMKIPFCFCNGALYRVHEVFPDISQINQMPWDILKYKKLPESTWNKYHNNDMSGFRDDLDKKMSEFIVFGDIPLNKVHCIIVSTSNNTNKVEQTTSDIPLDVDVDVDGSFFA